jgi:hypothetical protein
MLQTDRKEDLQFTIYFSIGEFPPVVYPRAMRIFRELVNINSAMSDRYSVEILEH